MKKRINFTNQANVKSAKVKKQYRFEEILRLGRGKTNLLENLKGERIPDVSLAAHP